MEKTPLRGVFFEKEWKEKSCLLYTSLDILIKNNVSDIFVWSYRDGELAERMKYSLSIHFSWGVGWADLLYTDEFVSDVGELIEYEFEEQAQHLDQEHWVLVYNYNDKRVVTKK